MPIERSLAIHEAAHAVAAYRTDHRGDPGRFDGIHVRTQADAARGPLVAACGRTIDCLGIVLMPSLYSGLSYGRIHPWTEVTGLPPGRIAELRDLMVKQSLITLSGPIAEARVAGRLSKLAAMMWGQNVWASTSNLSAIPLPSQRSDFAKVQIAIAECATEVAEREHLFATLWEAAVAFVWTPAHWRAIRALADALQDRPTLTYAAAGRVIADAGGPQELARFTAFLARLATEEARAA